MQRGGFIEQVRKAFEVHDAVALLGPRQCGKTTLARRLFEMASVPPQNYFDLEAPVDEARLAEPITALQPLEGLVVIDEVQRRPELFKVLRVLLDSPNSRARFLILGSASRELIRQSSESLAGRIGYLELTPFQMSEVGIGEQRRLWLRGGFPRSFLAATNEISVAWRDAYIRTFLEQDLPALGIGTTAPAMRRFWMMLVHYHGQIFNAAEIASSLDISATTAKKYVDILESTLMVRRLQPWRENIKKRQVKRPKIYFRDSGLFHRLLLLAGDDAIYRHPKLGASWEGFATEEVLRALGAGPETSYFWAVHAQAELDLLVFHQGQRLGFEFKYGDAPTATKSMKTAIDTLGLDSLTVIYPGDKDYRLDDKTVAQSLASFVSAPVAP